MTVLYTDPLFLKHDTGRHPEKSERLRSVTKRLEEAKLLEKCKKGEYQPLTEKEVESVHSAKQIQSIKQIAEHGGGHADGDTVVSKDSFTVALAAAGACCSAVDAVVKGTDTNALCLVRPPGHHANATTSMGFCLFNNIALAANRARSVHKLSRILIVDWDVHHGNGTQDIFYEDPEIVFFSIHRFGNFYPGTGDSDETGKGKGANRIFNAPIRYGTSRKEYMAKFKNVLEKAADKCKPELVLISAGFDAHAKDPIGSLGLEVEDFVALSQEVLSVADTHCRGRVVSCLEGGYNLEMLAESVQAHLEVLLAGK